jgi:hypothetical protein
MPDGWDKLGIPAYTKCKKAKKLEDLYRFFFKSDVQFILMGRPH